MATFRDIKRKARRLLHDRLQVAAVYVEDSSDPLAPIQIVSARIHYTFDPLGGLKGTSFHTVEREEIKPKAILLVSEVPKPRRGAFISVDMGEAYRIDHVNPADDLTITAEILKAEKAEANLLPLRAVYIADPVNAPDTHQSIIARVDYLAVPNRIVFLASEVPTPLPGAIVSLRTGLAFGLIVLTLPNTFQVAQLSESATLGLPTP